MPSALMRCFVPVTATATEEIFRISIGVPGCCPATGVNLANTGKRRIFFYLLSSIIPFGSVAFGSHRQRERWQPGWWWNMGHVVRLGTTSLDAESASRRPHNAALTGRPTDKRSAISNSGPTLVKYDVNIYDEFAAVSDASVLLLEDLRETFSRTR